MTDQCAGCSGLPVDRRTFIGRGALAVAVLALAACAGDSTAPELAGPASIKVGNFPTLAGVNGVATMVLDGAPVAVVRTGNQSFVALSRVCPHQGATVAVSSAGFTCPRHGARFSAAGTWTGGQRTSNLRSYSTSYDSITDTLTIG